MPPPRICRVNVGFLYEIGKATIGAVLLDMDGGYVAAFSALLPDCFSPLMAEAFVCKEALSWLKNRGERSIELYTDCLTLQRYLTTPPSTVRSYIGYVIDSCRAATSSFDFCSFKFISRSDNYLAHVLASTAFQHSIAMYCDLFPPDIITTYF
ncbi:PREDICTED: uncharacterized protein LOC109150377 [Ipomoea nil]|uniref:uncharacterized protein LOC109150377 n=1 Tax=Ipomoea nil TaxID=35883 RepID=UPI000901469E|nr:PREDICTED: uncharacterized protein LOC109150377 [Ipomoea nil]